MDKHPNGETRITEMPNPRSKNGELDENSGLSGPHIVVIGTSHAACLSSTRFVKMALSVV